MADVEKTGNGIIFMKVGTHAGESLDDILERKQREIDESGVSFWGYGGPTLHPIMAVQPFVSEVQSNGYTIFLVMQKMDSRHFAEPERAREYSDDGVIWKDVPPGINVTGSRYALTIESLHPQEDELDYDRLLVGIGKSSGKAAREYVRGRVDKGCFRVIEAPRDRAKDAPKLRIDLVARLKAPYAVHVR